MAGAELAGQLAILEEALKRLESELARDASWTAMQSGTVIDEAARGELSKALEASPVFRAWRNMREATAVLKMRLGDAAEAQMAETPAETPEPGHDPAAARMATTLAEALQQMQPDEAEPENVPASVAQLLAAEVAAQVAPPPAAAPPVPAAVIQTAEEREQFDVGTRATQTVERILAIPVIEPMAPRRPAPPQAVVTPATHEPVVPPPARAPAPAANVAIGASVPQGAEDLAFLLTPTSRVQAPDQSPFLKRLVSEMQALPPADQPHAEPFMVPAATAAPTDGVTPEPVSREGDPEAARKPRLARLLKSWSRH